MMMNEPDDGWTNLPVLVQVRTGIPAVNEVQIRDSRLDTAPSPLSLGTPALSLRVLLHILSHAE
jgi:hypothetical protein